MLSLVPATAPSDLAAPLLADGFVHLRGPYASRELAWNRADEVFGSTTGRDAIAAGMPSLAIVGEFAVPPLGAAQRPFQTLHIDFGVPPGSAQPADVARFTALHLAADDAPTSADTRILRLRQLLGQREGGLSDFMRRVLATERGGELYARRQTMVEPVFAHTKFNRRCDRFL